MRELTRERGRLCIYFCESKHKKQQNFDAMSFEATDDEGTRHSQWCDQFRQLCEFKVQLGHCRVPSKYSANPKLSNWVSTQRTTHRLNQEGNPSSMTAERIRALDAVGFDWGTSKIDSWSVRFQQLCDFEAQFGHCRVPCGYSANPKLWRWVLTQRYNYRLYQEGKPSPMTAKRIRELERIGFAWGSSQTDSWSVRFQQLCDFKAQFSHCLVARQYAANPTLGKWVNTQRGCYRLYQEGKPSSMTTERIRELESIGFDWGSNQTDWSLRFQQLCEFKAQFGHCLVPNKYSANPMLGQWVSTQRYNYRFRQEGKPSPMTAERIRELESIGFDWGTSKTVWSVRFQQLCEFKAQFGHCLVSRQYAANPKLGKWVNTQRGCYRLYQEGKPSPMTAERIRELESIGFDGGADRASRLMMVRRRGYLSAEADMIITGVSRIGKTPRSVVLSQTMGFNVVNVPLVQEVPLPRQLLDRDSIDSRRFFCSTLNPSDLERIR